jgi:hypothetical protein
MYKKVFVLSHGTARRNAIEAVSSAPDGYKITISEPARSLDQNAALWPILEAFSAQLKWPVNGAMVSMVAEEWKDVLSAAFRRETARVAMGLDGGVVMLGCRTSKMSKREFSDFLEFLHATAAARGVVVYQEDECNT